MSSKKWSDRVARAAIAALVLLAAPVSSRAANLQCGSSEEAKAFELRQLQSRLMVAGLSCNQSVAYNNFVQHYKSRLAAAGISLKGYFQRTGGGEPALNQHITQIANVAGLSRAQAPENFCADTWTMFLLLEDEEEQLPVIAAKHLLPGILGPQECRATDKVITPPGIDARLTAPSALPVIKAAAP